MEEFCIVQKGDLHLFSCKNDSTKIWNHMMCQCRGIILDLTNNTILSIPLEHYEKNVNKPDWPEDGIQENLRNWNGPLISLFIYKGKLEAATGLHQSYVSLTIL